MRRLAAGLAAVAALTACAETDETARPTASPTATASAVRARPGGFVLPEPPAWEANPLRLPSSRQPLAEGARVFVPPKRALREAKLGRALPLELGTVVGVQAGEVIVRTAGAEPFPVHPGYCVAFVPGRVRTGDPVWVSFRGRLRHAVLSASSPKRAGVRFVDDGDNRGEQSVSPEDVAPRPRGLAPGNFATYLDAADKTWRHVLLVSGGEYADGGHRWLALAYGNVAVLVDQAVLRPLPLDLKLKAGMTVWVAERGRMLPGEIREVVVPGLVAVKRPFFGPSLFSGAGFVMLPAT